MNLRPLKTHVVTMSICWTLICLAHAQSSRPGWGSTPYSGGVTFRVWAPNATNVYVPGQFNGWSTSATPLGGELTNGIFDGVWSADVPGAVTGQQYKYYIDYSGGSAQAARTTLSMIPLPSTGMGTA
jgi:1,4-alpha-glucan branching enzyme